jgi:hypothetical protein
MVIMINDNPVTEEIDYKYVRFKEPFTMYSNVLNSDFTIPVGFVCDRESIPLIRGTSIRGGYAHDYFSRIDSSPVVDKKTCADIYLDIMTQRGNALWRRYIKYWVVRVWPMYFHRLKVMASYEEVSGLLEEGMSQG